MLSVSFTRGIDFALMIIRRGAQCQLYNVHVQPLSRGGSFSQKIESANPA
jgi:hypothetical protein